MTAHKKTYTVVTHLDEGRDSRRPRASEKAQPMIQEIEAVTLSSAVAKVARELAKAGENRVVVSAEEVSGWPSQTITDARIERALTSSPDVYDPVDPAEVAAIDHELYLSDEFGPWVETVATCLRESGLVPGVSLTFAYDFAMTVGSGTAMVEVYDSAEDTYRSVFTDQKNLIEDRSLSGMPALVSVARAIIYIVTANRLM